VFLIEIFHSSGGSCVAVDRRSVVTTCRLVQNSAQSAIVGRWNSETSRPFEEVRRATGGQSGCLGCHVVLR
jgi:hypothetical protein